MRTMSGLWRAAEQPDAAHEARKSEDRARITEMAATVEPPVAPFFAVGLRKLALMYVGTLGLYAIHWFFENWRIIRDRRQAKFDPKTRTLLTPVFSFLLFREIRREAEVGHIPTAFLPAGAWLLYLIGLLAAYVLIDGLWPIPMLLLYIPMHTAQGLANKVNELRAPLSDRNAVLSIGNKVTILCGSLLIALNIWGTYIDLHE
jgi:hypothetical protein